MQIARHAEHQKLNGNKTKTLCISVIYPKTSSSLNRIPPPFVFPREKGKGELKDERTRTNIMGREGEGGGNLPKDIESVT